MSSLFLVRRHSVVQIWQWHLLQFGLDVVHHRVGPEVTLTISAAALFSPSL